MTTKKDRSKVGYTLFNVPRDEAGRRFIETLRSYTNYDRFNVRVRGNGPRASVAREEGLRDRSYDQDIPLDKATHCRVYFEDKTEDKKRHDRAMNRFAISRTLTSLYDILGIDRPIPHPGNLKLSEGLVSPLKAQMTVGTTLCCDSTDAGRIAELEKKLGDLRVTLSEYSECVSDTQSQLDCSNESLERLTLSLSNCEQTISKKDEAIASAKEQVSRLSGDLKSAYRDLAKLRAYNNANCKVKDREPVIIRIGGRTVTVA